MPLELINVPLVSHERQPHQVCVADNKSQVLQVLQGKRGQSDVSVRQINSLISEQLLSLWPRLGDLDAKRVGSRLANNSSDFTVVEPNPLPFAHLRKDFGKCARDRSGSEEVTVRSDLRGFAGNGLAGQNKKVALAKHDPCFARGYSPNPSLPLSFVFGIDSHQDRIGRYISSLAATCPPSCSFTAEHLQKSPFAARILEGNAFSRFQLS